MDDFIDLPGTSGASYRFRRSALGELPVSAGNLVVAIGAGRGRKILLCAAARSLAAAAPHVAELLQANRSAKLFVRLNVVRQVREAEHADIVGAVQPVAAAPDLG